ncbi:MAG: CopD family protein [Wolbachia endosymbiont of Meromenopon meropis]|nr:CopD family protein [Wolbachia endosymbiont of Meromenopon meropis]
MFVIMWMAGMLYLPRLYVYHATIKSGSEGDILLKMMEKRLLKFIINPAMLFSLSFGIALTIIKKPYYEIWFHIKGLGLLIMFVIYALLIKYRKDFAMNFNKKSHIYFRILNEIVTILIVIIIIAVVIKPLR